MTAGQTGFKQLLNNVAHYARFVRALPTETNSPAALGVNTEAKEFIGNCAHQSKVVLPQNGIEIIKEFLERKRRDGTNKEKEIYDGMTEHQFVERLLKKRPLMFNFRTDTVVFDEAKKQEMATNPDKVRKLKNPTDSWTKEFSKVGQDDEDPFIGIRDFLTPDERLLSSYLINTASDTPCINDISYEHPDSPGQVGTYIDNVFLVAQTGIRLEQAGGSEHPLVISYTGQTQLSAHMSLFWEQRGLNFAEPTEVLALEDSDLKTRENATHISYVGEHDRALKVFNKTNYKALLRPTIEAYLATVNSQGIEKGLDVSAFMAAMGTSSWAGDVPTRLLVECQIELLKDCITQGVYPSIYGLSLSGYAGKVNQKPGENTDSYVRRMRERTTLLEELTQKLQPSDENRVATNSIPLIMTDSKGNQIRIAFTDQNPGVPELFLGDSDRMRAMNVSWDPNAQPGNEYNAGMKNLSQDPVVACATMFPILHNVLINGANMLRNIYQVGNDNLLQSTMAESLSSTSTEVFRGLISRGRLSLFHNPRPSEATDTPLYLTSDQLQKAQVYLDEITFERDQKTPGSKSFLLKDAKVRHFEKIIEAATIGGGNCRPEIEAAKRDPSFMHGHFKNRAATLVAEFETEGLMEKQSTQRL